VFTNHSIHDNNHAMISTHDIKMQKHCGYRIGPQNGIPVLIQGSCRAVPYLNYFSLLESNPYCVYFIDPFNFHWDDNEKLVNLDESLSLQENNQSILSLLPTIKIFIHEHYQSFGMFNTSLSSNKNIYQFGLSPELDISIPNFNDHFILVKDFICHDWFKKELEEPSISPACLAKIYTEGEEAKAKFMASSLLSSFPEISPYFHDNFLSTRLFCSHNHISKNYSLFIWELLAEKFLSIPKEKALTNQIQSLSIYENSQTPLTNYDLLLRSYNWNEQIVDLTA